MSLLRPPLAVSPPVPSWTLMVSFADAAHGLVAVLAVEVVVAGVPGMVGPVWPGQLLWESFESGEDLGRDRGYPVKVVLMRA
ncbi:MAG: hypothetical protein M3460_23170 [Actinomycetota bacterium]|nr:hypothetical protein [Actinomycetota bacterium]